MGDKSHEKHEGHIPEDSSESPDVQELECNGDGEVTTEGISFDEWAHQAGLTRKSTSYLRQQDLASFNTLRLLSDEDIKELDITFGQKKLLLATLRQIFPHPVPGMSVKPIIVSAAATGQPPPDSSPNARQRAHSDDIQCGPAPKINMAAPTVTTNPTATGLSLSGVDISVVRRQAAQLEDAGKHLNTLLSNTPTVNAADTVVTHGMNTQSSAPSTASISHNMNENKYHNIYGQLDPRSILTAKATTKKAVHITQFLSERSKKKRQNRRKEIVLSQGHGANSESDRLVLKTEEEHPYARIAMEEWGAANCRLMNYLIQDGQLARKDLEFYLAYTAKVYDLAELYEWHSVLDFDYCYRELQAEHGFPWGTFAPHLEQRLVPRKYNPTNNKGTPMTAEKRGQQQECKLFKASKGTYCPFGEECRYKHTVRPFLDNAPTTRPNNRGTVPAAVQPPPRTRGTDQPAQ